MWCKFCPGWTPQKEQKTNKQKIKGNERLEVDETHLLTKGYLPNGGLLLVLSMVKGTGEHHRYVPPRP